MAREWKPVFKMLIQWKSVFEEDHFVGDGRFGVSSVSREPHSTILFWFTIGTYLVSNAWLYAGSDYFSFFTFPLFIIGSFCGRYRHDGGGNLCSIDCEGVHSTISRQQDSLVYISVIQSSYLDWIPFARTSNWLNIHFGGLCRWYWWWGGSFQGREQCEGDIGDQGRSVRGFFLNLAIWWVVSRISCLWLDFYFPICTWVGRSRTNFLM